MGGDQAGGLALAILIVMVLIVVGAVALFFLVARRLTRNLAPSRRRLVVGLMILAGAGAGWMAVMATFYESSFSPPPRLHLVTAPGFDAPAVVFLEDPRAPAAVEWQDSWLPFTAATATVEVPPSGIVRVRGFGLMAGRADLDVIWSSGMQGWGAGGGPGPHSLGANAYLVTGRPDVPPGEEAQFTGEADVAAYVAEREGRR